MMITLLTTRLKRSEAVIGFIVVPLRALTDLETADCQERQDNQF
jgi:hypothetical protein